MKASQRSAQYFVATGYGPATVNTKLLYEKRNKMIKTTYSTMLLVIGFLAIMLTVPSAHLMAQTAEEHNSVTSSTNSTSSTSEAQPAEERTSVTNSTKSTSFTTEAQAMETHHCVGHCRDHYNRSLSECNEPGHPHHNKCDKWAREREQECLSTCK
jgi:cytoskeletal protein RodZ